MLKKILIESIKDKTGKVSLAKLSSWLLLFLIGVASFTFVGIEIGNFLISKDKGVVYTIPFEHITLFGLILGHHLGLLGIKANGDNKAMAAGMLDGYKSSVVNPNSDTDTGKTSKSESTEVVDEESMDSDSTH